VELDCLSSEAVPPDPPHALNPEQAHALKAIQATNGFKAFLLDGITGSGKTEVYLQAIAAVLEQGKQVLVLIPEIGLTPQTVQRFRARFHQHSVALYHSGLSDGERSCTWQTTRDGRARIVIGTRSAIFLAFADLGLIIVDEEHDASYKQQEGLRYQARDLAVLRAQSASCAIVLGSATPSLESLHNANEARYEALHLRDRAGGAQPPAFRLLDIRQQRMHAGLSEPLLKEIRRQLDQGGQVLLFLNRRGYAPTLTCHTCGWVAQCPRCDAQMTVHRQAHDLACHHCGTRIAMHTRCPECGSVELRDFGVGTEKLAQAIAEHFPGVATIRIDRDSTRNKGQIEALLNEAESGRARILIGTQMLAKGHHFPNVSLVAIIHADGGLFGADFRATEHLAQLLIQVAGRAGRAERAGEVWIQTHHPDHPLLQTLVREGYAAFAMLALAERKLAGLPPFSHFALVRTESTQAETGMQFLQQALQTADPLDAAKDVQFLGPVPAPMERRAGRWRAQLLLQAQSRSALHRLLEAWVGSLESLPAARKVRWSLDVDPMDLF
jgi:primosomal protein N' (replication factor Y)